MTLKKSEIPGQVQSILNEFFDIIDDLFVSYFIIENSLIFYRRNYIPKMKETLLQDVDITGVSVEEIYKKAVHIGDEDDAGAMVYQTTFKQVLSIVETPKKVGNRQAGNLIVTIYQYWDDTYRKEIADVIGIKKNDLQGDIWGDLRLLRQSILHRKFQAVDEIVRCKIIKSFSPGEALKFDCKILNCIKNELHDWYNKFMYDVINTCKILPDKK